MQSDKETINSLVRIESKENNVNSHWNTGCTKTDVAMACEICEYHNVRPHTDKLILR